jgi:hypothetical protein
MKVAEIQQAKDEPIRKQNQTLDPDYLYLVV